jgi:hypothetical protein
MQAKLWQQGLYFCGITIDIEIFPLKAMIVVMPARFSNLVKRVPNWKSLWCHDRIGKKWLFW